MKQETTKKERSDKIKALDPDQFESYEDYFLAIHLNPRVALMHSVGFVIGLFIFPLAIYFLSWYLFIIYLCFFYGFGFISHYLFDGVPSRTAKEAPWKSFEYAIKVNLLYMLGRLPKVRRELFNKYDFLENVYFKSH